MTTPLDISTDTVTITPPDALGGGSIILRQPSFAEWHGLAKAHRELEGKTPPADLIAKTITTCIADADGKPAGIEAAKVLRSSHKLVMWIYARCWETVLKSGDEVVADLEKNSEAGQG